MTYHAKVFISCGQQADRGELQVANAVADALVEQGFDPYIAASQQTLRGLKENIFDQLTDSEYFLFVDLKREQLETVGDAEFRGSVFCQQELAIAAHLGIDVIAFQEEGIRPLEGILCFLQTNCFTFSDRSSLPARVVEELNKRDWSPTWKKALSIDPTIVPHRNANRHPENVKGDFYHLLVRNNHLREVARNVYGYLDSVVEASTGEPVEYNPVEFKWAGYTLPNATIFPGALRRLDAFWIPHPRPNLPQFNNFSDSTAFIPRIQGPGQWYLDYSVVSDTVPGASRRFLLTLDGTVSGVTIEAV